MKGSLAFTLKKFSAPLARWGVALGSIGFFLLYEELPQLALQAQYGVFPGYKDVLVYMGWMSQKRANKLDAMLPQVDQLNRPIRDPKPDEDAE